MLHVVPLGGLGEFGMNMLALTWADTTIVVDAGVMFPDPELLGVDLIIPDLTYLQQKGRVAALVLTHGHEDHIGGVPFVMPYVDGPVYGTPLTLALVEPKLAEHGIDVARARLTAVRPSERVTVGPFEIEFIRVTHSIPDCVALAIHTPAGIVIHTGDFKIDQTPIDGQHFDVHRFAQLGSAGVLALFADSTNIDRRGFTGSESEIVEAFEEIFTSTHRPADRRGVLVEHLPHAAAGRPGDAIRSEGRVRRPRHGPELRDRPAARLSPHSRRRADSRFRRRQLPPPRTCCAWRPALRANRCRRCRGLRSTITAT